MPRQYNRRPGLRGVAEVAINMAGNPFPQLVRFAAHDRPSQTFPVPPVADLPPQWHTPANRGSPAISQRPRQGVTPRMNTMPRGQVSDDDEDMQMAVTLTEPMSNAVALRAEGGGDGARKGAKETPISIQRSHFGLPETVTQVLTGTNYFAAITPANFQSMTRVQFRLTSIIDRMITTPSTPTPSAAYAAGIYNRMMFPQSAGTWNASPAYYPSDTTDELQWLDYFVLMYQYYHVMGVEWELTMANPQTNVNCDITVATSIDTYSAGNATNVHPNGASMEEMEQWPDVRWGPVVPYVTASERTFRTLKGYYRPGKVKQNVENDEDVKTWTKVNAAPSLTEVLNVYFGKSMFNAVTSSTGLNCRMKWRFIVQFKDLNVPYRWPAIAQTPIAVNAPTDILVTP